MTDDLRDRIAAAIYNASDEYARKLMVRPDCPGASEMDGDGKPVCYELADAVIAELGLHEETMHNPNGAILTRLDGKVLADNRYMRRWATNWEADESPVK